MSLSLEQVLVIARQLAPYISYATQIDSYLEDLDTLTESECVVVFALAEAGKLPLKELAAQHPALLDWFAVIDV